MCLVNLCCSKKHPVIFDWVSKKIHFRTNCKMTFLKSSLFSGWSLFSIRSCKMRKIGLFVDSEIVLSTSYGKTRVFINKTLSTETAYQQDLINRDLLSTRLIVGKVGPGMWCGKFNSTSG